MKSVTIILLILTFSSSAIAQNVSLQKLNRSLNYVSQLVDQGNVLMAKDIRQFRDSNDYMAHNCAAKKKLKEAEDYVAQNISDPYYNALSHLLIAEAYACNNPELPRALEGRGNQTVLWFPYKDVMRNLDSALSRVVWLKKGTYANRFGLIADIAFFVHLQYDLLRQSVEGIQTEDAGTATIVEKPSRICYTRGLQAIDQAIENEKKSLFSLKRKQDGILELSEKAYLYKYVKSRFVENGIESSEPALLEVNSQRIDSLESMSRLAAKRSRVLFQHTHSFKFFDFIGDVFIPKYGLAKKAIALIFGQ
jgi:hypothetical protein